MNMVTVTGNIVSRNGVTLFFTDGTSQVLPSDGFKTQAILDAVLPSLARSTPIAIDLDNYSIGKKIEEATNGAVKIDNSNGNFSITTQHGTIENAEPLRKHVEEAALSGGGKGLKLFMAQFGEMAKTRKHSANELLTFMKGADLPIADDGSLIGYKVLNKQSDLMVDNYTCRVKQKLGSLVFMPASKVDDNRRDACGVGLHIAARNYLNGFWYSANPVLCLVKIKPGDVISVPYNEASKMRVCAYHIVGVLSDADGEAIAKHGKRIEDIPNAAKLLANIVAGNHPPILQRVGIGMANGKDETSGAITVTDLAKPAKARKVKPTRTLRSTIKATVAKVKDVIGKALPYEKKLAKAQKAYDDGMSIRDIAKKFAMDRESLGKNLKRVAGR